MPGDGTRPAGTRTEPPPARILDLTRSAARAGRRATGIDRVERAYLDAVLDAPVPAYGLVRTRLGYLLLDERGLVAVRDKLHGRAGWGREDALSILFRARAVAARRAESDLRRAAMARCRPGGLANLLRRCVPPGAAYLNVGHTQLEDAALAAIRAGTGGRVAVFIHDTIPLDYPEYQRPVVPRLFAARLRAAGAGADVILCNSRHTEGRLRCHLPDRARIPGIVVAPLGVSVPEPAGGGPFYRDMPDAPYFIALGTIEPRKRHDLLLDVWEDLATSRPAATVPPLLICGSRGWNNAGVFARLDALPPDGPVREMPDLPDAVIVALLRGATALLFPSEAEGYGLPPLEALAVGTPPVVLDLPVYRETLGNSAVYLNETDSYLWKNAVERLMAETGRVGEAKVATGFVPPSWRDHFNVVFEVT